MSLTYTEAAQRVMVALDYPDAPAAQRLLQQLEGVPCYMKVGMQLYYAAGPAFVMGLKERGYSVFLDLKMHDIPNTVRGGAASIAQLGVDMFNVHAAGGVAMMEAAVEGASRGSGTKPLIIAVTQLTSTSLQVMNEQIGIEGSVEAAVVRYAQLAKQAGLDGVVSSPLEVQPVKDACGRSFLTVTPGIRPLGTDVADQTRILTPADALRGGTDYMVIGRPITQAPDPRLALESIIKELTSV